MRNFKSVNGKKIAQRCIIAGLVAMGWQAAPAMAQSRHTISIGKISSTKACTTYVMSSGKSTLSAESERNLCQRKLADVAGERLRSKFLDHAHEP
jgi:hypothetical protein